MNLMEKKLFVSLGNGLLVYPVTEADINQVSVYFPGENTVRKVDSNIVDFFFYLKRFGMIREHLLNIMVLKQYLLMLIWNR
jgi:hypothetical protein